MGLHPEWRQVDNKIRRLNLRIVDFRLLSNDLRIDRSNLSSNDPEINKVKLFESIQKKREQVLLEREAIQKEMEHLTVFFHKGAEPEYRDLRRFFLSYLYHTTRNSMPNLATNEFDDLLLGSVNGVHFDLPEWESVYFDAFLCRKVAMGKRISISASGLDTSPLAIALGIMRAGSQKHCDDIGCRKEECLILKEDYERLFEAIFHRKIRTLINQKARGEMSILFDRVLKIQRSTGGVKVSSVILEPPLLSVN